MTNVDDSKISSIRNLQYKLKNATVFASDEGVLFVDYLDKTEDISPEVSGKGLNAEARMYIENSLQSNEERFRGQIETLGRLGLLPGSRVLDIGCGGGKFLALAKKAGAIVKGIELEDARAYYAQTVNQVEVFKYPIEHSSWISEYGTYDFVTLWDVIEHVNFPVATLRAAFRMLKPGGYIILDTPCKDSFYHRVGDITYRMSRGRFPTFLNALYSSHPFGHKQIFSTSELRRILEEVGANVLEVEKFHELSFPVRHYIRHLTRSDVMADLLSPAARLFFKAVRIRNKMLVVAIRCQ